MSLPTQPPPLSRAVIITVLAASLMVGAFGVTSQSYWIDEALSVIVAQAPNPAEAWKYMQAVSGSTLQMPLYQVYLYAWHKVFGDGEWIMRASNIPWFVLGQAAFLFFLRDRPRLALTACLLAAVSPMLWVYIDETRPYIMQYSAACWLTASLVRLSSTSNTEPSALNPQLLTALAAAFCVLFASSLLGAVWAVCFAAAFLWLRAWTKLPAKDVRFWAIVALSVVLALLSAGYYLFTWSGAKRGYHLSGASPLGIPLVAFEMLGFMGLGPGKAALRADPVNSLFRALPALAPLAVVLLGLAVVWLKSIRTRRIHRTSIVSWLLALALPATVIVCAFFSQGHRPLPRHFIPALPAVVLALAAVMNLALAQKSYFWRAWAFLLPVLWLASSLNLRWQPFHAKENYREAAAIATAALRSNKEVWWAADPAAAHVYETPIAFEKVSGRAWAIQAPAWDGIRYKFPPDLIVLSRPDVYDPAGTVERYARENNLAPVQNLTGIVVFARKGSSPSAIEP